MTNQNPTILLSIRETGTTDQPVFLFNVLINDEVVASNQSLTTAESQNVRELSRRYNALFEQRYAPQIASDALKTIGAELFDIWLARVWDKVREKCPTGSARLLAVASDVADVLNLPCLNWTRRSRRGVVIGATTCAASPSRLNARACGCAARTF